MSKKTILAIILIFLGISTGLLVLFLYSMSGGKVPITLLFMSMAIACIITGSILGFSRLLDRSVIPVLDEIHKDIEDDIQDLKKLRFTNTIWMIAISGISGLAFLFFVLRLHKLEAMWGAIPVAIPTLIGMIALAWFIPRTLWFQNSRVYTPMWVFLIPAAGLFFTLVFGITQTENLSVIRASPQESIEYNSYQYTGYFFEDVLGAGEWGMQLDFLSCDGEECGFLLVIALIILTFILVIGSALIPHFWFFSGTILLSIMALISIHDLRVRRSKPVGELENA